MKGLRTVAVVLFFVACSSGPVPRNILPPEKMQKVVYDLVRIDELVNNFVAKDSTIDLKKKRSLLYEQAFKVNNTDKKQFYASYRYYQQHPNLQKALYDSLYESMNRKQVGANKADSLKLVK